MSSSVAVCTVKPCTTGTGSHALDSEVTQRIGDGFPPSVDPKIHLGKLLERLGLKGGDQLLVRLVCSQHETDDDNSKEFTSILPAAPDQPGSSSDQVA